MREHPLHRLKWVDPSTLTANNYNPNRVFRPEMELLKLSLLEDGWTQPVVVNRQNEIVDGFHRWTLASTDQEVRAMTDGLLPVVVLDEADAARQMMATVRHNRARGAHGILKMSSIVRQLLDSGLSNEEICRRMGMDEEELIRLSDARGSPDKVGQDSFGLGWIPDGSAR